MLGHFHWVLLSRLHALIIMQLELNGKRSHKKSETTSSEQLFIVDVVNVSDASLEQK